MRTYHLLITGAIGLTLWSAGNTASAQIFDWLNPPTPTSAPSASPVYEWQDVYSGGVYITREQFSKLQSGGVYHWSDLARKPYGRLKSDDGLEHYYFGFGFGDGGVILVTDGSGILQSWDIVGQAIAPGFNPANVSGYNYYPPATPAPVEAELSGECVP